jgi:hypothetical protein
MSIIPATLEAEIGRILVQSQPGAKTARLYPKQKT